MDNDNDKKENSYYQSESHRAEIHSTKQGDAGSAENSFYLNREAASTNLESLKSVDSENRKFHIIAPTAKPPYGIPAMKEYALAPAVKQAGVLPASPAMSKDEVNMKLIEILEKQLALLKDESGEKNKLKVQEVTMDLMEAYQEMTVSLKAKKKSFA